MTDNLAARLRAELEEMAKMASVNMELWGRFSNRVLAAADALEAQAQEIEELRAAMRPISLWSFEAKDNTPAIKELHDDILRVRAALKGEKA